MSLPVNCVLEMKCNCLYWGNPLPPPITVFFSLGGMILKYYDEICNIFLLPYRNNLPNLKTQQKIQGGK